MLYGRAKSVVYVLLAILLLWGGAKDYCLVVSLASTETSDLGITALGFAAQLLGAFLIFSGLSNQNGYFRRITEYVRSRSMKAALFVLPFVLFFGSHDMIASGLYQVKRGERIANAEASDTALCRCSWLRILRSDGSA